MPTEHARKLASWLNLLTAALLPALLLVLPGYLGWRQSADADRVTQGGVRQNREETLRNRELGRQIDRKLDVLLQRTAPPPAATQP